MTKFHINKHGTPSPCRAQKGNCPLGGDDGTENHFDSIEEAQSAADNINEEDHGILHGINDYDDYDDDEEVDYDFVESERERIFNDFSETASTRFKDDVGKKDPEVQEMSDKYNITPPWEALEKYAERRQQNIESSNNKSRGEFYYETTDSHSIMINELNERNYEPHDEIQRLYDNGTITEKEKRGLDSTAYKALDYYKNGVSTLEDINREGEDYMDWRELDTHPHADTGLDSFRRELNSAKTVKRFVESS